MGVVWAITKLAFKEILRKKDFYVALILLVVILFYIAQIKFYDVSSAVRYMREIALTLIYLISAIIMIPLAARQLALEKSQRTLGVLLAKPVTRLQFVIGKYLSAFLAGATCFVIYYAAFSFVALGGDKPVGLGMLFQTGLLFLLCLMVLAAATSCFSYYMSLGANISLSAVLFFTMTFYGESLDLFAQKAGVVPYYFGMILYYILPHFEFFDLRQRLIHNWEPLPWTLVGILFIYALTVSTSFISLAWLRFRKQVI